MHMYFRLTPGRYSSTYVSKKQASNPKKGNDMKRTDLERKLKGLGFVLLRNGGSHDIWGKDSHHISIPRHNEIKESLAKSIIKKAESKH